jgi:hypothetical protein
MSQKRRPDPKKEQFWREALSAWRESGQSIRAFCAGRALAEASFYGWRRELARREQAKPKVQRRSPFVPVRILPDAVLEVVLVSGVVVRVPPAADAATVAKLVAALGAPAC